MPRKTKNNNLGNVDEIVESLASLNITNHNNKLSSLDLLNKALESHTIDVIATALNICVGTIRRWQELVSVPPQYCFDLLRLLDRDIDCSAFSIKEKDQFFTPTDTVAHCWKVFLEVAGDLIIDDYVFIEPSAGDGAFLDVLPQSSLAFDIEPRSDRRAIVKQDYLTWSPPDEQSKKYIVFGNPPFGLRGHLALQFINHSLPFADYVCFILPQLFESDGRGSPRKRVKGYNLIHSEKLTPLFYTPDGADVDVNVVFQIWSKVRSNDSYTIGVNSHDDVKIYSLSDGGTVATTRNKAMLGVCDVYLPSTCFGKENMRLYDSFEELPGRKGYGIIFSANKSEYLKKARETDWREAGFLSTNSAYNLRTSIIIKCLTQE